MGSSHLRNLFVLYLSYFSHVYWVSGSSPWQNSLFSGNTDSKPSRHTLTDANTALFL